MPSTCGNIKLCCPDGCVYDELWFTICGVTQKMTGNQLVFDVDDSFFIHGTLPETPNQSAELLLELLNTSVANFTVTYEVRWTMIVNSVGFDTGTVTFELSCGILQCKTLADLRFAGQKISGFAKIYVANAQGRCPSEICCECNTYELSPISIYNDVDDTAADFELVTGSSLIAKGSKIHVKMTIRLSDQNKEIRMGYSSTLFRMDPDAGFGVFPPPLSEDVVNTFRYYVWDGTDTTQVYELFLELNDDPCPDPQAVGNLDPVHCIQFWLRNGDHRRGITISCGA